METVKVLPNGTELNVMGGAYGKDEVYDEDIEVVIKIPKYAYDDLQKNKNLPNRSGIEKAISNGIVLPKGHGDLVDMNTVTSTYNLQGELTSYDAVVVLEADKEA